MSASLIEKYQEFSLEQLIHIIESDEDDYTPKAKEAAQNVLGSRMVLPETLQFLAKAYWETKIQKEFKILLRENVLPISQFLDDVTLRAMFQKEFEKWQDKKELFAIDTTKYWFV